MKKILMSRGADKVVSTCVKVQPGEEVVIITEESKMRIAEAVAAAVYRVGAHPILTIMEPREPYERRQGGDTERFQRRCTDPVQ